jgi:hypothetical protein
MLTEELVTNPAKRRVTPNAKMIGWGVGAGSLTVAGMALGASACKAVEAI